jgi:hypothetical protein
MQFGDVVAILESLAAEDVEYVLVGGIAVGLHGFERATRDIDLFVRPTEDVGRLRRALRRVYDDPAIDEISASDLAGDYPTIRYGPPDSDFFIDLLGRLGTTVAFNDLEAEPIDVGGVAVPVATPRTLYRIKRDTVRPVDRIDAEVLREAFDLEDED